MWILIIIVLIVVILVVVVKNDNKQIQINHLQNGGFSKSYPLVTKCLEEEYEMSFFEDLGNSFSYSKNVMDVNNQRGILYIGLKLNAGRETIIFSSFTSSTGIKSEGQNVSTLYTANKYIVEGIKISIDKLILDGVLPYTKNSLDLIRIINLVETDNTFKQIPTSKDLTIDSQIENNLRFVNVKKAGTLNKLLSIQERKEINHLIIVGFLNGSDIKLIREMCGADTRGWEVKGYNLQILDLSNVKIVAGGELYFVRATTNFPTFYTSNDTFNNFLFYGCNNLVSIILPNGLTTWGDNVFENCKNISNIEIDISNDNFYSENGILFNKQKTKLIVYPRSKKDIDVYNIPNTVRVIDSYAFYSCKLQEILIPNSVSHVLWMAFYYCNELKSLKVLRKIPPVITSKSINLPTNCTIQIPVGTLSTYKMSEGWKELRNISEIINPSSD